ncbi:MAG: CehA/McbA family metallohydrolase [Ignavibacteriae bacterium]|nr:CehA/McbA family metallohydrolase [Ignavibacteriota bacterium]
MYEYSGAIHIHSKFSDGTGSVDEIAKAASEVNLDFIMLTDHNTLLAKDEGYEKWFDKTMVIVGYEINDTNNKNHYLVMGLEELIGTFRVLYNGELGCNLTAEEYVAEIKKKGGVGFIAHPFEKRNQYPEHPAYPWTAWKSKDFDGIEIWNHMSEWVEGLNDDNKVQRFLHPLKSIVAPDKEAVKKWDEINKDRKVTAIGSIDAHAHKQNLMGFYTIEVFPYKVLFKSIRTHVLLNEEIKKGDNANFGKYKKDIVEALRYGKSFIVNSYYGDGKGFRFFAEYDGATYNLGDEIHIDKKKSKNIIFNVYVPKEAKLKLIKDGKCIEEHTGLGSVWDEIEPGNYRIECWLGEKAWIFSNHIRVTDKRK